MPVTNFDWYSTIAKQHVVCEDYTLTGWKPFPYMIVCDGCSSSEHTDVGARILAWSAKRALQRFRLLPNYHEIGQTIIEHAVKTAAQLELNSSCLDATLLLGFYLDGCCHVSMYGDGYVVSVGSRGELAYRDISFAKNMPYYLNYWIDADRRALYLNHNEGQTAAMTLSEYADEQEKISRKDYDAPLMWTFPESEYQLVALASDGVAALVSNEENRKVPVREVLEQLTAYKTTKGEFVKRRAKRMLKNYSKQEITPTDDLTIATMLFDM